MAFEPGHKGLSGLAPGKDGKLPKIMESKSPDPKMQSAEHEAEGEKMSSMHDHGDGSFHTMKDGAREEHPDMGHALMAMASHHKPEGKHFHAHHDGMSVHSHGSAAGEHDGPNEHASTDEAADHMKNYLSDDDSAQPEETAQDHEGLSGFGG